MKTTMKNIVSLLICAFIVFRLVSCKQKQPTEPPSESGRAASWGTDIDYLDSQLKAKELGFSSLISVEHFDSTLGSIKSSVDSLQDYEIYIKLQQLIASFNVAHLMVYPPASWKFHLLPVLAHVFPDGSYIIMADQQNAALLGQKIISIGGVTVQTVEDSLAKIISHENDYWLKDQMPGALSCVEILKYYGFADSLSAVDFDIEGTGNVTVSSVAKTINNITSGLTSVLSGKTLPLYMQNQSSYYWFTFIKGNEVLYIKYNVCEESPNISFSNFTNEIANFADSNQVEKVVIDFRNNGGGNSNVVGPLLSYLQNSPFNQAGKLFVITDRGTFSSASLNAISFKQTTNCILVGEPTGGKPNSYGEVLTFTLPNSGINVQYCTKYFQEMNDDPAALFPDHEIETTAQDFMNGVDPVLDFILNYQ